MLGQVVILLFKELLNHFPKQLAHFAFPPRMYEGGFKGLPILTNAGYFSVFQC